MPTGEIYSWAWAAPAELSPYIPTRGHNVLALHGGSQGALAVCSTAGSAGRPICCTGVDGDANGVSVVSDAAALDGAHAVSVGASHCLGLRRLEREGLGGDTVEVVGWGEGSQGQLGVGRAGVRWEVPRPIPSLAGKRVIQISCGSAHSAAVTAAGDLYTWGRGFEGQLGHGNGVNAKASVVDPARAADGLSLSPRLVTHFMRVKRSQGAPPAAGVSAVACGTNFTIVVARGGEVWTFGEGGCGQLGVGRKTRSCAPLLALAACPETGCPLVAVAAGWAHALALSENGAVYAWGLNHVGQLGVGDVQPRHAPQRVCFDPAPPAARPSLISAPPTEDEEASLPAPVVVQEVHALGSRSVALARCGDVYAWGACGNRGGGCTAHTVSAANRPRRVEALAGKGAASVCLHTRGGAALVPFSIAAVAPQMAVTGGGTRLTLFGSGFWRSDDIVVRFVVGVGPRAPSKTAVGTYAPPEAPGGMERIVCKVPRFPEAGVARVEVSLSTGTAAFTDTGRTVDFYDEPVLAAITPALCRPSAPTQVLRIDGSGLGALALAPALSVLFEEIGGATRVYATPARLAPESLLRMGSGSTVSLASDDGGYASDGARSRGQQLYVTCLPPRVAGPLPFVAKVSVVPDGAAVASPAAPPRTPAAAARGALVFTLHDPHLDSAQPPAVPARGGTRVALRGRNLYVSADAAVRLAGGGAGGRAAAAMDVTVDVAGQRLLFTVPPLAALAAQAEATVRVEAMLGGGEWFQLAAPLTVYADAAVSLVAGASHHPACGGTALALLMGDAGDGGAAFVDEAAAAARVQCSALGVDAMLPLHMVRQRRSTTSAQAPEAATAAADAAAAAEEGGSGGGGGEGAAAAAAPVVGAANATSATYVPVEAAAGGLAEGAIPEEPEEGSGGGGGARRTATILTVELPAIETPAAAPDSAPTADEGAAAPAGTGPKSYAATVAIAANGCDFATPVPFLFYDDPVFETIEPAAIKELDGTPITLRGRGIFCAEGASPTVRLRASNGDEPLDVPAQVVEVGEGEAAAAVVNFAVPAALPVSAQFPLHVVGVALDGRHFVGTALALAWAGKKRK